jgi:hypothetical protein
MRCSACSQVSFLLMQEPAKKELLRFEADQDAEPPRRAFAIVQCWPQLPLVEVVVDLSSSPPSVSTWEEVCTIALNPTADTYAARFCSTLSTPPVSLLDPV